VPIKGLPLRHASLLDDCVLYLGFASFLLYLPAKDRNTFPQIDSVRVLGTPEEPRAELRGINLVGSQVTVNAAGKQATVVRLIATEVPLYSDATASTKRPDVVGLLLRSSEASREFLRIVPTYPNRYKAGCYVTHGPHVAGSGVGETWYRDPVSGKIEYAWTGSLVIAPNNLGNVGTFKFGGISILPQSVQTQIGENRCLRVTGWGRDGPIQKESDVTDRVRWKNIKERRHLLSTACRSGLQQVPTGTYTFLSLDVIY
jgi:hypothetical protein